MASGRPSEEVKQSANEQSQFKPGDVMFETSYGSPFALDKVTNLVLSGGAAKGMILLGALGALNMEPLNLMRQIERMAVTSIGGFIGVGLSVGLSPDYMQIKAYRESRHILKLADVTNPAKHDAFLATTLFHGVKNMSRFGGVFLGDHIEERVVEMLTAKENKLPEEYRKPDLTLFELHQLKEKHPELRLIDVYYTTRDCKTGQDVMLSWDSEGFIDDLPFTDIPTKKLRIKDLPIRKAVRYTMSVPFAYRPGDGRFWDGALMANIPITTFDDERFLPKGETLWKDPKDEPGAKGKNMRTLALAFMPSRKKVKVEPALLKHPFSLLAPPTFFKDIKAKIMQPFLLEEKLIRLTGNDCRTCYFDASIIPSTQLKFDGDLLERVFISGHDQALGFLRYHKIDILKPARDRYEKIFGSSGSR